MDSLLPPNSTQLERDLETVFDRATKLPVVIRDLWNPDTCPAALIPWLAWSLNVETWDSDWPENLKRQRLRDIVEIKRRKGTVKSVRDVVASFGGVAALKEWHQQSPFGVPYSFQIAIDAGAAGGVTEDVQQQIIEEVTRTKPVRSPFSVSFAIDAILGVGMVAAADPITYRRIQFLAS
jgi:phage tail P2-like protein